MNHRVMKKAKRFTMFLDAAMQKEARYWAKAHGLSLSHYGRVAIAERIKFDREHYDDVHPSIRRRK